MNRSLIRTALVATLVACGAHAAHAGPEMLEVDSRFRAKIAKEKIRMGAQERQAEEQGKGKSADASRCGSQNIGNVNTGGRIGTQPREVFVFAPNAINIVGRGGC